MKITVTRTFKPITREIEGCLECPWLAREQDMSMTITSCQHPKFDNGISDAGSYKFVIEDISPWGKPVFSKHCPLVKISVDKSQKGHECIAC